MANGSDDRISVRFTSGFRKRLTAAKEEKARRTGAPVASISDQEIGIELLAQALDARKVPFFEDDPDEHPAEDDALNGRR